MKALVTIWLFAVTAYSGCSSPNVTELDVTLETEFEIGVDAGDELLPLFEDVRSIVTDAPQILHATPLWLDKRDRIYLRRVRHMPSVVVARITIEKRGAVN